MLDDEQLLQQMQDGQRSAMEVFYRRYAGYLFAVCRRYIADNEDAKDILQESFIKIFSSIKSFRFNSDNPKDKSSLRSWATKIVVNCALSHLRNQRLTFVSTDEVDISDIPDESPDVSRVPAEKIQALIEELPSGYRTVFNLYAIEQLSHKKIGEILGINEKSSASQYLRARRILQQKIKKILG